MNFAHLFLVGINAEPIMSDMYTELGAAVAIIVMLLVIRFSSGSKETQHG